MFAVLDTNVLVSALRSSRGPSHKVLRCVRNGQIRITLSVALTLEYEDVPLRPDMVPGFTTTQLRHVVDGLCALAEHRRIHFIWRPHLSDPGDDMIFELALAASAPFIITKCARLRRE